MMDDARERLMQVVQVHRDEDALGSIYRGYITNYVMGVIYVL